MSKIIDSTPTKSHAAKSGSTKPGANKARGLGRGLSALIPESDFDLLSGVARGQIAPQPILPPTKPAEAVKTPVEAHLEAKGTPTPSEAIVAPANEVPAQPATENKANGNEIRYLAVKSIVPNPWQPRQVFSEEELQELADSVREHGVLQPVLVRPLPATEGEAAPVDQYQLIAGERRWRAAQRAGLERVPAIVRAVDDRSALELAIIENVQRHDISALESAQAYRRLAKEFGLTQEQIATRVGKSRVAVANTMRLLDLIPEALDALREGKLSEGHGRALLMAPTDAARRALLRRTLRDGLTVREVEKLARASSEAESNEPTPNLPRPQRADVERLENSLARALGVRLQLRPRGRGGSLVLSYSSPEELQRLVRKLTGGDQPSS